MVVMKMQCMMNLYLTPRIDNSSSIFRLLSVTKNPSGDILGRKRAAGDTLVSKQPAFLGLFRYLRGSHGLSAQRAGRTKSRGQKGLQLEVGAWRAPRLLVAQYFCQDQMGCNLLISFGLHRTLLVSDYICFHEIIGL